MVMAMFVPAHNQFSLTCLEVYYFDFQQAKALWGGYLLETVVKRFIDWNVDCLLVAIEERSK